MKLHQATVGGDKKKMPAKGPRSLSRYNPKSLDFRPSSFNISMLQEWLSFRGRQCNKSHLETGQHDFFCPSICMKDRRGKIQRFITFSKEQWVRQEGRIS